MRVFDRVISRTASALDPSRLHATRALAALASSAWTSPRSNAIAVPCRAAWKRCTGNPSNILVYEVGGKRFAYFKTSEPERWRFSFKVAPERFLELTDQPGIKPARWLGKHHWVTVVDVSSVPAAYLKDLVAWSYRHALAKLTRRQREAIAGAAADPGDAVR
ncbi:MAG: MmcQ/YjbR family DNA-binding protein [Pseudoxanthomonas sp.]